MISYSHSTDEIWLDFEALTEESIQLSPTAVDQAIALSNKIINPQQQWQAYLNALALFGFEQWLEERSPQLSVNHEECSIFNPVIANVIGAVCNLKLNDFQLCLIGTGSLNDQELSLPIAVIDLPEFIHHFYVVVEVQEEQETVVVHSFLSYQQLVDQRKKVVFKAESDWTYQLPLTWFDHNPEHLLEALNCLQAKGMVLPTANSDRLTQLAGMKSQLETLLPQLKSSDYQLWQILTWEQASVIITNPELLNWLYQLQTQPLTEITTNPTDYLSDLLQLMTQKAMNVGRWLSDELDELAQELSWQLLPSFVPAVALRTVTEEFEVIIRELQHKNVKIPLEARGAYRNLRLGGISLRLYALTWPLLSGSIPEWTLLLILGAPCQTSLPRHLKLRISDQTGILVEQVLETDHNYPYLFSTVVGTWDEKFIANISLGAGIEETLPPFRFELVP